MRTAAPCSPPAIPRPSHLEEVREYEAALDIDALCDKALAGREMIRLYPRRKERTMNKTLEQQVIAALKAHGLTLATAESCTGGLTAKRLTDSTRRVGGVLRRRGQLYQRREGAGAGRAHGTLEAYSAVSDPTARAMAEGVRTLTGADFGLSVTGVAGPDRDDAGHDVDGAGGMSTRNETAAQLLALSPATAAPSAPPPQTRNPSACCWTT